MSSQIEQIRDPVERYRQALSLMAFKARGGYPVTYQWRIANEAAKEARRMYPGREFPLPPLEQCRNCSSAGAAFKGLYG